MVVVKIAPQTRKIGSSTRLTLNPTCLDHRKPRLLYMSYYRARVYAKARG